MNPLAKAISSMQATFSPCRSSSVCTNMRLHSSESYVPVSSHAMPRPSGCDLELPCAQVARLTSVISSSPRADGFRFLRDVDDPAVVEVQPGDGPVDLGLLRLLLDAEGLERLVELDDAVTLRVVHLVGEDARPGRQLGRLLEDRSGRGRRRCCRRGSGRRARRR